MTRRTRVLLRALAFDIGERAVAVRFVAAECARYGNDLEASRLMGKADGLQMARTLALELAADGESEE